MLSEKACLKINGLCQDLLAANMIGYNTEPTGGAMASSCQPVSAMAEKKRAREVGADHASHPADTEVARPQKQQRTASDSAAQVCKACVLVYYLCMNSLLRVVVLHVVLCRVRWVENNKFIKSH